jgi:hypothetical protein
MKHKFVSTIIFAITALAIGNFFDGLYGAGPVTHYFGLIHTAVAGAILFVIACAFSLFSSRFGIVCALAACILSWPYFGIQLFAIPWDSIFSLMRYPEWRDKFAAILGLVISSVYSVTQLRLLWRKPGANIAIPGPSATTR